MMSILEQVNDARKDIRTDDYAMSIGEWVSLYEDGDLDIHPEFQRFYRWSDVQKSNLIESILLGIPLPPIFVSQRKDGVWDVIDGLQRLSTIFQLLGVLKDTNGKQVEPLRLSKTKYLDLLDGFYWDDDDKALPMELKRIIRRAKLSVSIVLRESEKNAKFDLFERLNTGGSKLSPQEVRNCILVMVNSDFYEWLRELADYEPFKLTTSLSDRPLLEAYDIELVLRFLLFSRATEDQLKEIGDVGVYLSDGMVDLAEDKSFDRDAWGKDFRCVFDKLNTELGDDAFKRYSRHKGKHEGGFLVSMFEAVTSGVLEGLDKKKLREDLSVAVAEIWETDQFTEWVSSGVTASRRLRRIVPFARKHFCVDENTN